MKHATQRSRHWRPAQRSTDSQRGAILIYVIVVMIVASALGAGIVSLTTSSTLSELHYNPTDQARHLAMSGLHYAKTSLDADNPDFKQGIDNREFRLSAHESIVLTVQENSENSGEFDIRSIGKVNTDNIQQAAAFQVALAGYSPSSAAAPLGQEFNFSVMDEQQIQGFIDNPQLRFIGEKSDWIAGGGEKEKNDGIYKAEGEKVLKNKTSGALQQYPSQFLFVPIPTQCNEYVIRAVARTTSSNQGHGYGILFDTILNNNNIESGYTFQFDPGYPVGGHLLINRWSYSNENPVSSYGDRKYLPDTNTNPHWWYEDLHYIQLTVSTQAPGKRKIRASVFDLKDDASYDMETFTDFYFGPWEHRLSFEHEYDFSIPAGKQLYTGLRTWGSQSFFHYLGIEMRCGTGKVIWVNADGEMTWHDFDHQLVRNDSSEQRKLIITSAVGSQTISRPDQEFNFSAPDGVYIESGVNLTGEHNQNKIKIESTSGDVVIEPGVNLKTIGNENNTKGEVYIKSHNDLYAKGLDIKARRYIYFEAGGNIYVQNSDLNISQQNQSGIFFDVAAPSAGKVFIDNLFLKKVPTVEPNCTRHSGKERPGSAYFCPR